MDVLEWLQMNALTDGCVYWVVEWLSEEWNGRWRGILGVGVAIRVVCLSDGLNA